MSNSSPDKIHGFTWLRVILSWMIVIWHGHFLGISPAMTVQKRYVPNLLDIFHMNIVQLGVPLFLLISLFLFIRKETKKQLKPGYLGNRLLHFAVVYFVWRFVYFCFSIGNLWVSARGIPRNIYHLIFGADTVLYFFVELIWMTGVTALFNHFLKTSTPRQKLILYSLGGGVSLVLTSSLYFLPLGLRIETLRYFSPIAFLPYLFFAQILYLLVYNYSKYLNILSFWGVLLSLGFIVLDWLILPSAVYLQNGIGAAITGYGRCSLVFSSVTVFLCFLKIESPPPRVINNLSDISLYVFVIHPLAIRLCSRFSHGIYICFVCLITLLCSELLFVVMKHFHLSDNKGKNEKSFGKI